MWTCYDADLDMAYVLFADEHPGEAAIKLVRGTPFYLLWTEKTACKAVKPSKA